jgi:hypothetical protein
VADETVNAFITEAMAACTSQDYDEFLALWSAAADPLSRAEFEYGWNAVQRIRVVVVEKALYKTGDEDEGAEPPVVYAFLAEVNLDPEHQAAKSEPNREVILMAVRERDRWRLAHAPKRMRAWLRDKVKPNSSDPALPAKDLLTKDGR